MKNRRGFALILVLGLLTSLTILFALVNARGHGQILFLAGQRGVVEAAEERAMLMRLAAESFGRATGEMVVEADGHEVRLTVEEGEARGSFVVLVDEVADGGYWVAANGSVQFTAY